MSQNKLNNVKAEEFYSFLAEAGGAPENRILERLGDGYYQLEITEAQKRQAEDDIQTVEDGLRELLRNARDGKATKVYIATNKSEHMRHLTVIDNGQGIPKKYHELVFEPRVTSRLDSAHTDYWGFHGRGMALYSIQARFDVCQLVFSAPGKGTRVKLEANTERLPENSEQSIKPEVLFKDSEYTLKGPHNILRLATEFSLFEKGNIEVFLGSPAEITAALLQDPAYATSFNSADKLKQWAESFGLTLSSRTAARVQAKEIAPLAPLVSLFEKQAPLSKAQQLDKELRKLSVAKDHKRTLAENIRPYLVDFLAEYYLELEGEPSLTIRNNKLLISCEISRDWD